MNDGQLAGLYLLFRLVVVLAIMALAIRSLGFNAYGLGAGVGMIGAILYTRAKQPWQNW